MEAVLDRPPVLEREIEERLFTPDDGMPWDKRKPADLLFRPEIVIPKFCQPRYKASVITYSSSGDMSGVSLVGGCTMEVATLKAHVKADQLRSKNTIGNSYTVYSPREMVPKRFYLVNAQSSDGTGIMIAPGQQYEARRDEQY